METKLKDYLPFYLGNKVKVYDGRELVVCGYNINSNYIQNILGEETIKISDCQLMLRQLSSMTEEEALHVAWLTMDSQKLGDDARISKDEINGNVVYNDGGLMVDEDAAVVIDLACRCFEGQVCIRNDGDIELWNDAGEKLPIDNQAEKVRYLLSKGFDLFQLIEKGLAIDYSK
jgi:hypothetical protein